MAGPEGGGGAVAQTGGVRVAELVATLSYAADLGLGQPLAHCMRQTAIALRLADLAGASEREREATYYLGLMINAYCHADASEQARWFGDDIAFKAAVYDILGMNTAQVVAFIVRRVVSHGSGLDRARRLAEFPRSGWKEVMDFLSTHARLANLAAAAARVWRLSDVEIATLHRAGLVHDLGRLGVSNAIWDKRGPLTGSQTQHVRMHPYLTERMLAGVTALAASREIAGRHHERLDGSGYPRGLTGAQLRPADRLLAAADAYHAMTEPRPHREPLTPDEAAGEITAEVKAGRLDGGAVAAVLTAAGRAGPGRRAWPDELTAREVEVLGLLARGQSNRQVATRLTVTPKTVANHVEHLYTKIGVSSRAAATLYAMQHGLVGAFEPPTD